MLAKTKGPLFHHHVSPVQDAVLPLATVFGRRAAVVLSRQESTLVPAAVLPPPEAMVGAMTRGDRGWI